MKTKTPYGLNWLALAIILLIAAFFWHQHGGFISMTLFALTSAAGDTSASSAIQTALSDLNSFLIWLIVVAFMIARCFIKTGLGK